MKFLIDECLHTALVALARDRGHECFHVNWLGLGGETDWALMPRIIEGNFTFVTNNARDFRKLYGKEELHSGLVILVQQAPPARQCELFEAVLEELSITDELFNEIIEISFDDEELVITRYILPGIE